MIYIDSKNFAVLGLEPLIALNGMQFDLTTPQGRLIASLMASLAEFERDLIRERVRSGMAAAKARGRRFGRQPGQRPKSDRLAPRVVALVEEGMSYRTIARQLSISKNTVTDIIKRHRTGAAGPEQGNQHGA